MQSPYINIKTAQNESIQYELADLGTRILALLIDGAILFLWHAISSFITNYVFILDASNLESIFLFVAILLPYLVIFLYGPVMCSIMDGQTIGKKAMKIKVIKMNGNKANFGHYLVRTVLFYLPDVYLIGLILVTSSDYRQRIGDLVAGTIVVKTESPNQTMGASYSKDTSYTPMFDKVNLLSDGDAKVIREIIDPNNIPNPELVQKTVEKLKAILQVPNTLLDGMPFLRQVIKDYDYQQQS